MLRARRLGARRKDDWALYSATHPDAVGQLLRLADGARNVVELGTAIGWTTGALALADRKRTVTSFDPFYREGRNECLALLPRSARRRITLIPEPGSSGPASAEPADLLFIDSSHEKTETIAEFQAWASATRAGGLIVFHDWENPNYPGVTEAIRELGLDGRVVLDRLSGVSQTDRPPFVKPF